jgi:hypothetical protein
MFLHGWACLPLSNQAIGIFLIGIPVHVVAKTAFFFTDFARKRTHTLDKFIRFELLDNNLYLIEMQFLLLVASFMQITKPRLIL